MKKITDLKSILVFMFVFVFAAGQVQAGEPISPETDPVSSTMTMGELADKEAEKEAAAEGDEQEDAKNMFDAVADIGIKPLDNAADQTESVPIVTSEDPLKYDSATGTTYVPMNEEGDQKQSYRIPLDSSTNRVNQGDIVQFSINGTGYNGVVLSTGPYLVGTNPDVFYVDTNNDGKTDYRVDSGGRVLKYDPSTGEYYEVMDNQGDQMQVKVVEPENVTIQDGGDTPVAPAPSAPTVTSEDDLGNIRPPEPLPTPAPVRVYQVPLDPKKDYVRSGDIVQFSINGTKYEGVVVFTSSDSTLTNGPSVFYVDTNKDGEADYQVHSDGKVWKYDPSTNRYYEVMD
jgi:hypothetical protein